MTSSLKPLSLYGGVMGPNPVKVTFILQELGIPYEPIYVPFHEVKNPEYTAINPNGRLPSIVDPNTTPPTTLWESGAIIEYLIAKYDLTNKISFPQNSTEDFLTKQYLYFQVSGQGPYYGQARFFIISHPENLPSVIERYRNEIKRVSGVLERVLEGKEWLVGGKCTYADLSFIAWQELARVTVSKETDLEKEFPNVWAWMERMKARKAIKEVLVEVEKKKIEFGYKPQLKHG
ncbi:glutathione S-transferase [Bisporella sp. PMI_857]|nr:glutathione S-transferase [Bisporella sp. PMI_857]